MSNKNTEGYLAFLLLPETDHATRANKAKEWRRSVDGAFGARNKGVQEAITEGVKK